METFAILTAFAAVLMIGFGIYTLNRRDLDLAALIGLYPLSAGAMILVVEVILILILHVHIGWV